MIRKSIYALLTLVMVGSISASAQKVAHINSQSIMLDMPQKDSIEKSVKAFRMEKEKELQDMQNYFQKKYNEYMSIKDSLSASMRQFYENDLQQMQERIYVAQDEASELIQLKQNEAFQKLVAIIKAATDRVAKAQNINYVIDVAYLMTNNGGTDITPLVRKELKLPPASEKPKGGATNGVPNGGGK